MIALKEHGYQHVKRGQLVIHAMDAFAGAIGVSDSNGKCTPEYIVCDPRDPETVPGYFAQALRLAAHSNFIQISCSAVRERAPRLRYPNFGEMQIPNPPPSEQRAIVRFLTHADQLIKQYIRAKQKLIKLLEEQKQAIIHRAVTRGLDPNVKLKPSGVEWLGDVPEHWGVKRAKQVCTAIIDCKNRTPDMIPGGEYTVVRTTNIRNGGFHLTGSYPTDRRNYEIWTQRGAPRQGDVFFTREAPAGEACLVPNIENLCMGQRMMYFRPNPEMLDCTFMLHSIYGPIVRTYIQVECNGSTVGHLRLGQVSALPLLWCPVGEQRSIVAHIETMVAPLAEAISRAHRELSLLREYRTRLIADVVTGKLDVRAAAATLPDVLDEPEQAVEMDEAADEELDAAESPEGEE